MKNLYVFLMLMGLASAWANDGGGTVGSGTNGDRVQSDSFGLPDDGIPINVPAPSMGAIRLVDQNGNTIGGPFFSRWAKAHPNEYGRKINYIGSIKRICKFQERKSGACVAPTEPVSLDLRVTEIKVPAGRYIVTSEFGESVILDVAPGEIKAVKFVLTKLPVVAGVKDYRIYEIDNNPRHFIKKLLLNNWSDNIYDDEDNLFSECQNSNMNQGSARPMCAAYMSDNYSWFAKNYRIKDHGSNGLVYSFPWYIQTWKGNYREVQYGELSAEGGKHIVLPGQEFFILPGKFKLGTALNKQDGGGFGAPNDGVVQWQEVEFR